MVYIYGRMGDGGMCGDLAGWGAGGTGWVGGCVYFMSLSLSLSQWRYGDLAGWEDGDLAGEREREREREIYGCKCLHTRSEITHSLSK